VEGKGDMVPVYLGAFTCRALTRCSQCRLETGILLNANKKCYHFGNLEA